MAFLSGQRRPPQGNGRMTDQAVGIVIGKGTRMPTRAADWMKQALRDLEQAEESRRTGRHEWACFAAEQAAEKGVRSRYPNSHPEGTPFEHYGPLQSDEALRYAREIIEFARSQMA